jgi:hypothetical protein
VDHRTYTGSLFGAVKYIDRKKEKKKKERKEKKRERETETV